MSVFMTRYGEPIVRVLGTYEKGSRSLIVALETIVKTAMDQVRQDSQDELAATNCLGHHEGPAHGLVCRRCYDAVEQGKLSPEEQETVLSQKEQEEQDAIVKSVQLLLK